MPPLPPPTPSALPPIQPGVGPREWLDDRRIDLLEQVNDPIGEFGEGKIGQGRKDTYDTLIALGLSPDEAIELIRNDMIASLTPPDPGGGGAGNALGYAQLAETQRNNAFSRVYDKIRLLSATDDLQEARRENVMAAMLEAAPLMVAPGTEYLGGRAPGGPAEALGVPTARLPTFELPIQELLNAPTAVTPDLIQQQLGALQ